MQTAARDDWISMKSIEDSGRLQWEKEEPVIVRPYNSFSQNPRNSSTSELLQVCRYAESVDRKSRNGRNRGVASKVP